MNPQSGHAHEGGLSVRDQIERYRTAFISVVTMFIIAAAVAGYILAHENLHLPSWVPIFGRSYYTLKADFQTAQAVTPGQGQAVTIAGAKVGEIASVDLRNGQALVAMKITPKYAHFYKNATLLLRPKTQLQDITVEVNPGTPSAGRLKSGEVLPQSQTAPNIDFDEFLAGLDKETRDYLQELLAGAAGGFKNNSAAFAATVKRFAPTARYTQEIASQLEARHANVARSIHNFRLLMEALGGKDTQLAQLVDASNAVFKTFADEEANLQSTLHLLPGALHKTGVGLGKLQQASDQLGPALRELRPFAKALGPANEATKRTAAETKPVIEKEIRPFAREILPVINQLGPSTEGLSEAIPKLATSFTVLTEFFNELAYNPGPSKPGFLFFVPWGNHNLNSVVSTSDANGPLGRTLLYFNCEILPLFTGVGEINANVNVLIGLLKPPTKQDCAAAGILKGSGTTVKAAASARTNPLTGTGGALGGLGTGPFGGAAAHAAKAGGKG